MYDDANSILENSSEEIRAFAREYPEIILEYGNELYPLHLLCKDLHKTDDPQARIRLIQQLTNVETSCLLQQDLDKKVPLYHILKGVSDELLNNNPEYMDLLNTMVRAQPSAVSMKTKYGEMALHLVCREITGQNTLTLVRLLCEADPKAATECDDFGMLPLHFAAFYQPTDVVQFLIQAYPDGTTHPDSDDNLPLHLACDNYAPGIIQLFVESCPDALMHRNNHGQTPLHIACESRRSFNVIELLAQNGREVLSWQDEYRCLPLHHICDNYPLQEVLAYLRLHMPLLPQLIKVKNRWGGTPGHKSNFVKRVTGLLEEEESIKETMNSMELNLDAKEALQLSKVIPVASMEWIKDNNEKSLERLASIEAELNDLVASNS